MRILPGKLLSAARSQAGQTTIEFLLIVPVLVATCAIAVQLLLILQARTIVDYAAFAAARSAAVWMPAAAPSPPWNTPLRDLDRECARRIQMSAALACLPISPRITTLGGSVEAGPEGSGSDLANIQAVLRSADRLSYARRATDVTVRLVSGQTTPGRQMRLIEATVQHRMYLVIPVADRLFGRAPPPVGLDGHNAHFLNVQTHYVLPLEDELGAGTAGDTDG